MGRGTAYRNLEEPSVATKIDETALSRDRSVGNLSRAAKPTVVSVMVQDTPTNALDDPYSDLILAQPNKRDALVPTMSDESLLVPSKKQSPEEKQKQKGKLS